MGHIVLFQEARCTRQQLVAAGPSLHVSMLRPSRDASLLLHRPHHHSRRRHSRRRLDAPLRRRRATREVASGCWPKAHHRQPPETISFPTATPTRRTRQQPINNPSTSRRYPRHIRPFGTRPWDQARTSGFAQPFANLKHMFCSYASCRTLD